MSGLQQQDTLSAPGHASRAWNTLNIGCWGRRCELTTVWKRALPWTTLTMAFLLVVCIPSDRSIWIDEAQTARYAAEPTLAGAVENLGTEIAQSDAQMPLAMLSAWVGGKLLGTSEWALRAPNIGWAIIAIIGMWLTARRLGLPGLELAFALHPFVWLYVDEARPYAMQLAAASWLLFGLVDFVDRRATGRVWIWAWAIGGVVISGASMLGLVIVAAVSLVLVGVVVRESWSIPRTSLPLIAAGTAVLTAIAGYYVWTLSRGVGVLALSTGAGGGKLWIPGLQNVGFALYEFGGFAGLGPARQDLRVFGLTGGLDAFVSLMKPYASQLVALLVTNAVLLFVWAQQLRRSPERTVLGAITIVPVIAGALLFILSSWMSFPFWGRHLAGVLPFLLTGGALALKTGSRTLRIGLVCSLAVCYSYSSFELRYDTRHSKDDYRTAALLAKRALGEHRYVWWSADAGAARYYGLPLTHDGGDRSAARVLMNPTVAEVEAASLPDVALLSKWDLYDRTGALRRVLDEHGFTVSRELTAFSVWERKRHEQTHAAH